LTRVGFEPTPLARHGSLPGGELKEIQ